MADLTEPSAPQPTPASKQPPLREDFWTEEATSTLVDDWGRRYLELSRGNLRGKDWQEVADAVNSLHGHTRKTRRTDVQCKNRIDTLKKKYKAEKAKISDSSPSAWPFFPRLDFLIGSSASNKNQGRPAPPMPKAEVPLHPSLSTTPPPPMALPIPTRKALTLPMLTPQKRPSLLAQSFRRNYSAIAAAAATDDGESEVGVRRLAKAIERFGVIYEKVEKMKQRQIVELEKQRMQFDKDLEVQRMKLFMDMQVQLEKLKQAKRSAGSSPGMI